MAVTREAVMLTEAHRLAQIRQVDVLSQLVIQLWNAYVKPDDLGRTVPIWVAFLVPQIQLMRLRSEQLASAYVQAFQKLELPDDDPLTPDPPDPLPDQAIVSSLYVTGPGSIEKKIIQARASGDVVTKADEQALIEATEDQAVKQAAAAAERHALDGGRDQVISAVKQDSRALGYLRVAKSDKPCYFCIALVSRGPVYKDDSFDHSDSRFVGFGDKKVHDNCHCTMEPVYSKAGGETDPVLAARKLWNDNAGGSMQAFRKAYEALVS